MNSLLLAVVDQLLSTAPRVSVTVTRPREPVVDGAPAATVPRVADTGTAIASEPAVIAKVVVVSSAWADPAKPANATTDVTPTATIFVRSIMSSLLPSRRNGRLRVQGTEQVVEPVSSAGHRSTGEQDLGPGCAP
jgi:hypothetical protein